MIVVVDVVRMYDEGVVIVVEFDFVDNGRI
jgi:hypothetical protein